LAIGWAAHAAEVAHIDLTKPINSSSGGRGETSGAFLFHPPKPDPHRVPPLSVEIQWVSKYSFPGGSATQLHIVLKNIGTTDFTLPIGVDSQSLLATAGGLT
jgi:hypothetical protein